MYFNQCQQKRQYKNKDLNIVNMMYGLNVRGHINMKLSTYS